MNSGIDLHQIQVGKINNRLTFPDTDTDIDHDILCHTSVARIRVHDLTILGGNNLTGFDLCEESLVFLRFDFERQLAGTKFRFFLSQGRAGFAFGPLNFPAIFFDVGFELGQSPIFGKIDQHSFFTTNQFGVDFLRLNGNSLRFQVVLRSITLLG